MLPRRARHVAWTRLLSQIPCGPLVAGALAMVVKTDDAPSVPSSTPLTLRRVDSTQRASPRCSAPSPTSASDPIAPSRVFSTALFSVRSGGLTSGDSWTSSTQLVRLDSVFRDAPRKVCGCPVTDCQAAGSTKVPSQSQAKNNHRMDGHAHRPNSEGGVCIYFVAACIPSLRDRFSKSRCCCRVPALRKPRGALRKVVWLSSDRLSGHGPTKFS